MKVKLASQFITISASRSRVFQMFASFGKDRPASETGEGATVLEREGNRLLVEFVSHDGGKLYRTLEEVILHPEERITFRHLESPLRYASEEFRFSEVPGGTHIAYQGQIECRTPFLPGVGWLLAILYVRPKYGGVVKRHMGNLKKAAEAPDLSDNMKADE